MPVEFEMVVLATRAPASTGGATERECGPLPREDQETGIMSATGYVAENGHREQAKPQALSCGDLLRVFESQQVQQDQQGLKSSRSG